MKIELTIPKWAENRHIYIIAGSEVIAKKEANNPFEIKTSRCNLCGECCKNCSPDWHLGIKEDGSCHYLIYEKTYIENELREGWVCSAPSFIRPWACVKGRGEKEDHCNIKFKEVK